ncbi:hypothetical protein [Burkholderia sp. Ac-20353]|uniref:hypothetical protein n=1 Tax=Burkholderia sp. Ac-20353 TaxID=2703894 RepID=UPI00197BF0CC|nr:hypothetical protein [Burkholderia sp. Ac-20353]MBN3789707.1 hypothetical protein [Burkholderia sp. Ac-20353]
MREVQIKPLPAEMRGKKFRPMPQPIFAGYNSDPTQEEIELAIALFEELDPESQEWYGGAHFVERMREKLR